MYNLNMIDIIVRFPGSQNVLSDLEPNLFTVRRPMAGTELSLDEIEKGVLILGTGNTMFLKF